MLDSIKVDALFVLICSYNQRIALAIGILLSKSAFLFFPNGQLHTPIPFFWKSALESKSPVNQFG